MKNLVPIILAAGSVLAAPGSASAYFPYENYGTRGPVSFHDSTTDVAYTCLYRTKSINYEYGVRRVRLRQINVRPPMMRAMSDGATVGWQVIVVRHGDDAFNTGTAGWKVVYKSAIQTAVATTEADAPFSRISVPAPIPHDSTDGFAFMIRIKVIWYTAGITEVQGWSKYAVNYSNWKLDGEYVSWRMGWGPYCVGRQSWGGELF